MVKGDVCLLRHVEQEYCSTLLSIVPSSIWVQLDCVWRSHYCVLVSKLTELSAQRRAAVIDRLCCYNCKLREGCNARMEDEQAKCHNQTVL